MRVTLLSSWSERKRGDCDPERITNCRPQKKHCFSSPSFLLPTSGSWTRRVHDGETEKCSDIKGVFSKKNYGLKPLQSTIGEEYSLPKLGHIEGFEAANEIDHLQPKGLVFQDGKAERFPYVW